MKERDSFIFYRSFYESILELPEDNQKDLLLAIANYSLNFKEPSLKGLSKAVWMLIKPQLDANNKRYENGTKGGRPKTKKKPNNNQDRTKTEPNKNVNVNNNVNKKDIQQRFSSWAIESNLDINKVLNQVDIAYLHYESQGFKDKYKKPINDLSVQIRKHWFKNLDEFKKDIGIVKDTSPVN